MPLRLWPVVILFLVVGVERSSGDDLSAIFTQAGLMLNRVGVGQVANGRGQLSVAAFRQVLGPPTRIRVEGHTQRLSWDDQGIQLEALAPESVPFAVLFEFRNPDSISQAIEPSQPYRGTLDCLGIRLSAGQRNDEQMKSLPAVGFNKDPESSSGQMWSVHLEHWAVFLQFSASETIDSAVIRILPDIY
jgi:hypothetical protein